MMKLSPATPAVRSIAAMLSAAGNSFGMPVALHAERGERDEHRARAVPRQDRAVLADEHEPRPGGRRFGKQVETGRRRRFGQRVAFGNLLGVALTGGKDRNAQNSDHACIRHETPPR
jgi:hypothetical protein